MNNGGLSIDRLKPHAAAICFVALMAAFLGCTAFMALRLGPLVVPDEVNHFQVSELFAGTWGIPVDTQATIPSGMIHRWPFLFFWVNGRIFNLVRWIAPLSTDRSLLVAFRFLGMMYSALAVVFAYLGAGEILKNRWAQLFVVFLLTTTMMFALLSAGDTYDNVINLLSFAAIYFFLRVLNGRLFWPNSLAWLAIVGVGGLVKITMLPLAGLMGLVWLAFVPKARGRLDLHPQWNVRTTALAVAAATALTMNIGLYGVNLIRYRSLVPGCEQVFSQQECQAYPQFVRNEELMLPEKAGLPELFRGEIPDPIRYGLGAWAPHMLGGIYGALTPQGRFFPADIILIGYELLIGLAILITILYRGKPSPAVIALTVIALGYALVLFADSYNAELAFGFKHVGVQGRYIFPVIGAFYTLMTRAFLKIPKPLLRGLAFELTGLFFLLNGPVSFLLRIYNQGDLRSLWFL